MKKNISETAENKTYSICKNSVINLHLPEINSSKTILIYGNTINFFGVPDNICFVGNNTNEYDRLCWLITAIRNKCQFYIICIDDTAIKYYKTLFNRIYNDFNYKANVKVELCNLVYNKEKRVEGKASIDILEKNIRKYNIMKFDICLMNPPYTAKSKGAQNFDELFLEKTLSIANTVISIQPATWFMNINKRVKILKGYHCEANLLSNGYELFKGDASVRQTLAIFKIEHGNGLTVKYDNKNIQQFQDHYQWSPACQYNILNIIIEKGKKLGNTYVGNYTSTLFHTRKADRNMKPFYNKWMVTLTDQNPATDSDIYDTIILKGKIIPEFNDGNYTNGFFAAFDTKEEAEHFIHYMMSDFVRSYVKAYRNGKHVYHAVKYIPWPDAGFLEDWNDDRIASIIDLKKEEQAELASIFPDCYNIRK